MPIQYRVRVRLLIAGNSTFEELGPLARGRFRFWSGGSMSMRIDRGCRSKDSLQLTSRLLLQAV